MRMSVKSNLLRAFKHLFLTLLAITDIIPFIWVLLSSFKNNTEIFTNPFALPVSVSFAKYYEAWQTANIQQYMLNSMIVSLCTVVIQVMLTAMACYVLTRLIKIKFLNTYLTLGLMIPIYAMLIPDFLTLVKVKLIDSLAGLTVVYVATNASFCFYLLTGFMKTVPMELDEAATIDGAGYTRTFFSVLLPVMKPGLATVATFSFLHSWNEFLFALVSISGESRMTLTLGINTLKGQYVTDYSLLCAGLMFAIVPVTLIYVLLQEQVIKGMTAGAVKA